MNGLVFSSLVLLFAHPLFAADTFIKSDDYQDGEEIVGKHLTDEDYRLIVEDVERNGEEFDWGWVKTPGRVAKPKVLGFDIAAYKTVSIPEVKNFAGLTAKDIPSKIAEAFKLAAEDLGWTVAEQGDLELSIALVDIKRDSTFILYANIKPFLEIELRLKDTKTGENLALIRHQAHADPVDDVALVLADKFSKFLK